uniref:hypothetical protein n=1 Tax=uncultured Tenacibaculum sp. TaxID=174713 RepID=UPI00260C2E0C|nr:hypothetical protein [uncultured Tenacibaculum sp.]
MKNQNYYILLLFLVFNFSCEKENNYFSSKPNQGQANDRIIGLLTNKKDYYGLNNLKGNIESIKYDVYSAIQKNNKVIKGDILNEAFKHVLIEFDKKMQVNRLNFFSYGNLSKQIEYKFNNKGKLTHYKEFFRENLKSEKMILIQNDTFNYDKHGNLTRRLSHNKHYSNATTENTYKYLYKNRNISEIIYNEQYDTLKRVNTFDNDNKIIEFKIFDISGKLTLICKQKFNKKGNITEKIFFDGDGLLTYQELFNYTQNEKLIENNEYLKNKLIKKYNYTYNKDSSLKKVDFYKFEEPDIGMTSTIYNDKNDIIEIKYYNPDGTFNSSGITEYEYDNYDNWIKKIEYDDKRAYAVIERKISYTN